MKPSFYTRIEIPEGTSREAREAFSQIVLRLAAPLSFQGLEDWAAEAGPEKVLGAEREFHDLSLSGKMNQEMRVYFGAREDAKKIAASLKTIFADISIRGPYRLAKKDWMQAWRKHYKTQILREAGATLAIVPAWKKVPERYKQFALRIYPGQAFGTGTHATTQLCLRLFLRHRNELPLPKGVFSVLDFGAGTGVLAIAAEKWAREVGLKFSGLAVESDPVALEQCAKNLRLNRAKNLKSALKMTAARKSSLVFANVLSPVLLAQRTKLLAAVAPGGLLLLSGILASEAEAFRKKFKAPGFVFCETEVQGDWCAIALRRKQAGPLNCA